MTPGETFTGGQALAQRLVDHGVETVFALAGAAHTHLLAALEDLGVTIIGNRHECSTVGAADGYARATGKIGVALIIAEQGVPNAVTGLVTAFHVGSPVVVLVARHPDIWMEPNTFNHPDHLSLVTPLTKWARTAPSPDRLPEYLDAAIRWAIEGQPGPTVLNFPGNFLAAGVKPCTLPLPKAARSPEADTATVLRIAEMIGAASRPVIIAGPGAAWTNAGPALNVLAHRHRIPVLGVGTGRGLVPEDDVVGWAYNDTQAYIDQADLIIAAGVHFNMWMGFGRPPRFARDAKVVQIDIKGEEISRAYAVDVPVVADPGKALQQIVDALGREAPRKHGSTWLTAAIKPRRDRIAEIVSETAEEIHPLQMHRAIAARMAPGDILVTDGANVGVWAQVSIPVRSGRSYLDHMPLGSMGMGMALAIGAAAASVETARRDKTEPRKVVLMSGDGALGFYMAELDTAFRHGLPLLIFVGNDGMWGTEYHGQIKAIGRAVNTLLRRSDYAQVARGLGCAGFSVSDPGAIDAIFDEAFGATLPALTDVAISNERGRELGERVFDKILIATHDLQLH